VSETTTAGNGAPVGPLQETVQSAVAPRRVVRWRTHLASAVTGGGMVAFGLLAWMVGSGQTAQPDLAATASIQQAQHPLVAGLMVGVSGPGFAPLNVLMVCGVVAFFWLAGLRVESYFAALSAIGISALGAALKQIWLRPRPGEELVQVLGSASGYSFPSGHTLLYVGFFGFLFYWVYASLRRGWLRTGFLWSLGLLIVLVGPSRIYLGHHWASDVLAGYALGFAYLLILIRAYSRVRLNAKAV
jgi:undecaprenyl-diphosphatase